MIRQLYRALNRRLAIRKNVETGRDLVIGTGGHVTAPDRLVIGRSVNIGRNFYMACNGSIGDGVLISSYVAIVGRYDHDMKAVGSWMTQSPWLYEPDARPRAAGDSIAIGDDVWIGCRALLLSGITIGRGAVIGAGSIVTRDVAPYAIVVGTPAVQVGQRFTPAEVAKHETLLSKRR